jgi:hypothetical protein
MRLARVARVFCSVWSAEPAMPIDHWLLLRVFINPQGFPPGKSRCLRCGREPDHLHWSSLVAQHLPIQTV